VIESRGFDVRVVARNRMMSLTVLSLPQRFKRILQAMMLAVAVVYMTLLLYQSAYGYPGIQVSSGFWVLSSGSEFWVLQSGRHTDCVGVVSSAKLSYVCVLGDLHKFCQEKARQFALSPLFRSRSLFRSDRRRRFVHFHKSTPAIWLLQLRMRPTSGFGR